MTDHVFALADAAATERLGAALAARCRAGDVLAVWGDLGAGKTVLARAFVRARTGDPEEEVPSPTFTLVQSYDGADGVPVFHYDLYRLECSDDVWELDLEDALADGVTVIEWPERLGALLPEDRLDVRLEHASPGEDADGRRAIVTPHGAWGTRQGKSACHVA
ncbi:tRNA (adenosine(37)-N6)-threonylcarbamoyltransferase complex ATPase subunit type 1 TsaE [Roseospira visakhapatnamensis]|uniref:tRNA threonylcarbamoyladenosine biosynthesis protein TsaE n=1 Tax=Roseospira visakhapatnamensis TaxID=390880 RepID=A0A7W6RA60_9PROT|nr:tRNA (adenosine(37)-N6)-threonylcarbamoyltransferase complex ATPase subunit type 1 TsaE [Roseospira visakhapatnamensis]MBB4264712.1 tRNA threonylcarbamoyladenosine biosynthesis protein TsaE [Roseospira visakhapatnamensis]